MAKTTLLKNKNIIDVVKYKWLWIIISSILIIPGIIAMVYSMTTYAEHSPMKLGIDFTGGSFIQYGFKKELKIDDIATIREKLKFIGIENAVIQIENAEKLKNQEIVQTSEQEIITETQKKTNKDLSKINSILSLRTRFLDDSKGKNETSKLNKFLKEDFGEFVPLQISAIGPTLGKQLLQNAVIALLLAFIGIVGYLSLRFKLDYAMFALVALFHDALFVCGVFSILGLLFNIEIDSLFITAILTVIGFSVHDTIVVFDRIRENSRFLAKKMSFNDVVNASVNQTLARSINTSITSLVTLFALYFFGGETTKNFILAMILGIIIGTYSSIFNASTLLAMWRSKDNSKKSHPKVA